MDLKVKIIEDPNWTSANYRSKLQAVKIVKNQCCLSLKEAKEVVEGKEFFVYEGDYPELKTALKTCGYILDTVVNDSVAPKENDDSLASEDEKIRKNIIKTVELYGPKTGDPKVYHDMISWLEKQGSAWSERDEVKDNWEYIQDFIGKIGHFPKDSDELDVLINYVLSKKQKLAWSEEDIKMIDWLIRCCEEEHRELCNDKYGHQDIVSDLKRDCRKKWDWLESLKNRVAPQNTWKPSDEQMTILWNYAEQNDYDGTVLTSLYNDLKKLKEE